MKNRALVIGITAGDPAGIGPEVALKAIEELALDGIRPVLICRHEIIGTLYTHYYHDYSAVREPSDILDCKNSRVLYNVPCDFPVPLHGQGSADTGAESRLYIDSAIDLWKAGIIDALVTGPVNKGLVEKSGVPFIGHTEYIAEAIGESKPYMLMFSEKYRVIPASTHLPISDLPGYLTEKRLFEVITAANEYIGAIDGGEPHLAIAGLDPHCGDGGAIGSFDSRVTAGAVARAREAGINVEGPLSADALFIPGTWRRYGCAIAQYHDQGLIPFKMLSFDSGVNATLGLSMVRTSPDHGTAFDIAGKGTANHRSMLAALGLAARLVAIKRKKEA